MTKKYSPRVQRTRDKILASALEIFSEKGFQGTTIREVARLAEVNDLTVYRHFESKENLFEEMVTRHTLLADMNRHIKNCFSGNLEDDVRSIIYTFTGILKKEINVIRLMLAESGRMEEGKKFLASFTQNILQGLTNFFERYQLSGQVREGVDCYAIAASLFGTVFSRLYAVILYGEVESLDKVMDDEDRLLNGWVDLYVSGLHTLEYVH
ncbi:TetR/AcrR family transcriptional regulator [Aneurinibacillus sp. Ricciae_BoGa-3]|uniref:TetR/AcrR family transcriptional regulator n=1 Tax=Aneurinibacillus sp. Ricciae_BoGa-3 TaxID=3022697 RepID=UPI0023403C5E|nr:TetR/AcrR family transcriptional regulator [Aneurinibacillus sp. Ricciae_BoGa-3]WCK55890.1 TetR/AcrR family transcriptional regulator [Aneurinibacillus sp. Ricciae_BoGa-3]